MSVISGGTWCAGAFRNRMQIDSPALIVTALNQWMGLAPDPLGRDYLVARAHITHGAYASAPSDSSKRAECQSQSTAVVWGTEYVYHWRIVIPPDWVNYGPSSYAAIAQAHAAGRSTRRCGASTVGSSASAAASRCDTRSDGATSPRSASPITW